MPWHLNHVCVIMAKLIPRYCWFVHDCIKWWKRNCGNLVSSCSFIALCDYGKVQKQTVPYYVLFSCVKQCCFPLLWKFRLSWLESLHLSYPEFWVCRIHLQNIQEERHLSVHFWRGWHMHIVFSIMRGKCLKDNKDGQWTQWSRRLPRPKMNMPQWFSPRIRFPTLHALTWCLGRYDNLILASFLFIDLNSSWVFFIPQPVYSVKVIICFQCRKIEKILCVLGLPAKLCWQTHFDCLGLITWEWFSHLLCTVMLYLMMLQLRNV